MKILFVHEVNYLEKVVFEMHEFPELLATRGHKVAFVDFPEGRPVRQGFRGSHSVVAGRTVDGSNIELFRLPRFGPYPIDRLFAALTSFRTIRKIIKEFSPDVIVLYGVPTNGPATILGAKNQRTPVIFRGIDVSTHLRRTVFSRLIGFSEKFVVRNADMCLVNNKHLGERYISLGASVDKIRLLPPGFVQSATSSVCDLDKAQCDHDFVFMGTLFRFSGLDWFIALLATNPLLKNKTLLVIGDGELSQSLRNQVTTLGLGQRVTFTGRVDFEDLQHHVRRGRVALLPFNETEVARFALPAKVFQYLIFGRPVVSTRLDGLQSIFPEGFGVAYVSPGKDFIEKACEVLTQPDESETSVIRGQYLIRERFNWDTVLNELELIMSELIDNELP